MSMISYLIYFPSPRHIALPSDSGTSATDHVIGNGNAGAVRWSLHILF